MKLVVTTIVTLGLLSLAGAAYSKSLPKDVSDAYKIYRMAQDSGDRKTMSEAAYRAWQAAEKSLGDSKTTGDLAHNFAVMYVTPEGVKSEERWDAFKRAIALSKFYGDVQDEVEIQRRLMMIDARIETPKVVFRGDGYVLIVKGRSDIQELEDVITAAGFQNSTYAAEMAAMSAKYHWMKGAWPEAIEMADQALEKFDRAELRTSSIHLITVRYYKARSLDALGETIKALLVYQDIVEISKQTGLGDKISGGAYSEMFDLQDELELEGSMGEAKDLGYRPISGQDFAGGDVRPIVRIPPIMPSQARRSGWVAVRFDVGKDGRPFNIEVTDASEKLFTRTAVKSVGKWVYATGENAEERKGVESIISFRLVDSRGRYIPYKKAKPK